MTLDWTQHHSSLKNLAKNMFRELGNLMNSQRNFTITGIRTNTIGIGNINQHYDIVHIPNMGGYRFPNHSALNSNNLILSPSGIDEVVLGRKVFKTEADWKISEPIIKNEVKKWHENINKIKYVHVVSESEKEQMRDYLKVPEEKIVVIPHGVDHEIFKPPENKENVRRKILAKFLINDNPYFVHVSEFNWARKNIFRILEAFKRIKSRGIEQNLIIIGKNDEIVSEKAMEIPGTYVLGFVSESHLVEFLQGADALILPSIHEGFGLPLVESMACGTPCLTSNVYSPPSVVGDAGILVDPQNTNEIANKMFELGSSENLRNELSKKSLNRSMDFSWKENASKLLELYQKVTPINGDNFEENYDKAAYRTITTIAEIVPGLQQQGLANDILEFDYSRLINWCLEVGLENEDVKDFLLPFREWLELNSN